jgi:VRR-NUC domain
MKISFQEIIGKIGEATAIRSLTESGYKVCRADAIDTVGHSLMFTESLTEFDCNNLSLLASLCLKHCYCEVKSKPCKTSPEEFFSFYARPEGPNLPNFGDNRFRPYCAIKMSFMAILDKCGNECSVRNCSIKAYLAIDHYISICSTLYRILNSEKGIEGEKQQREGIDRVLGKEPEVQECYQYLDEHRDTENLILRKKRLYDNRHTGYPGRIDLVGLKDNNNHLFEVKTNRGKLSPWQVIRLNWMKQHGFPVGIIRVDLNFGDKNRLIELYGLSDMGAVIETLSPTMSIEDFELSDYSNFHDIIPKEVEVKFFNYRWLITEFYHKAVSDNHSKRNA